MTTNLGVGRATEEDHHFFKASKLKNQQVIRRQIFPHPYGAIDILDQVPIQQVNFCFGGNTTNLI